MDSLKEVKIDDIDLLTAGVAIDKEMPLVTYPFACLQKANKDELFRLKSGPQK